MFLTNGEKLYEEPSSEIARKRKEEGRTSSRMLGCKEAIFLDFPDGELKVQSDKVHKRLSAIIEERSPDIIFSPSPIDYHDDHIATARIAHRLVDKSGACKLAFYEIYSTLRFNYLIDITDVVELKKKVISNYSSSLYGKPDVYIKASLGLNAQRSIFVQKNGYYEAFYILEKNDDPGIIYDYFSYRI